MADTYKITEQKAVVKRTYLNITKEVNFEQFIGNRLKQARKSSGLTQNELCNKLGLSRVSICNIEAGKHGINITTLKKYCDIFNITSYDLLGF